MLGGKKPSISSTGPTTLVSRDTRVVGDIHFSGTLDIEGVVQGNIVAEPDKEALVRVVDKGRVEGDIMAPSVVINGTVKGDVSSTRHLELASKARVEGNVLYALVEMAVGSEVNGSLKHHAVPEAARSSGKNAKKSGESAANVGESLPAGAAAKT